MMLIFGIIIGAGVMYFFVLQPSGDLKVERPKGVVSPDQMKTLDQEYNQRHQLISDSLVKRGGGDNRSSWYALDQVRDYLDYAEKESKKLGYTMDGVRIYLGAHPKENGKAGYTTMFFVPTGQAYKTEAGMINFSLQSGGNDIPGAPGMDYGNMGQPPSANYPQ